MSLVKWTIGFLAFQILIVILLIGIAPAFSEYTIVDEEVSNPSFNSTSTIDVNDLSLLEKFSYSVESIPFPLDYLVFFPTIIAGVLFIGWIRGVN